MEPSEVRQNLLEEKGKAWEELKTKLTEAEERGSLTQEDREYKDRVHARLDEIDGRLKLIDEREHADKMAEEARAQAEQFVRPDQVAPPAMDEDQRLLAFFRSGADPDSNGPKSHELTQWAKDHNEVRSLGNTEIRTNLNVGTSSAGGFTFNSTFRKQLYQHLVWHSAIRQTRATVLNSASGEALIMPKTLTHPSAGTIVSEAAAIGSTDPTFGQATLNAYKYAQLIQVSRELLADTQVDLLGYLASIIGRRLGDGMGADFVTGSGTSKPAGFLGAVGAGTIAKVTGGTGQSGIPTANEWMDIYHKLSPPYRQNAEWFIGDSALKNIRELKATTNSYLWGPGLNGAAPDTILGKPYVVDPNMVDCATSATSVAFGDFSTYFIRDVGGLRFERSDEYAFNTDLVTFRAIWRTDGRMLDLTGAIGYYVGGTA